jgi:6-phosphofructokinase 1
MKAFLSYAREHSKFVQDVAKILKRDYLDDLAFSPEVVRSDRSFQETTGKVIEGCDGVVVFAGADMPEQQVNEMNHACVKRKKLAAVLLPGEATLPPKLDMLKECEPRHITVCDANAALCTARKVAADLGVYRAFLCHSSKDAEFVIEVAKHLTRNLRGLFCYEEHKRADAPFQKTLGRALEQCNVMVVFAGATVPVPDYQLRELASAMELQSDFVVVLVPPQDVLPSDMNMLKGDDAERANAWTDPKAMRQEAARIARAIGRHLQLQPWLSVDGLPANMHMFDYEKDIINYFVEKARLEREMAGVAQDLVAGKTAGPQVRDLQDHLRQLREDYEPIRDKQLDGCPAQWPEVVRWMDRTVENPIPQNVIGSFRPDSARVVAAALSSYLPDDKSGDSGLPALVFPEAGPRKRLAYPKPGQNLNVAVLVSGGIAPGINAVIDGITQRHELYAQHHGYRVKVFGLQNGFLAFENLMRSYCTLSTREESMGVSLSTSSHASEAGAILGTSRFEDLMRTETTISKLEGIAEQLFHSEIDILYVIGGDGSMRAAHAVWNVAQDYARNRRLSHGLSVVAVPKTMDNDILWVWQTFGFPSAVERAREVLDNLAVEVKSNPRLGVVQLFGSDSGFVVSHAVLASRTGVCDAALIPEVDFSMECLARYLKEKMCRRRQEEQALIPYGFVVMAETAIPTDALDYIGMREIGLSEDEKKAVRDFVARRHEHKRIQGQTPDELRTAGLKIVSRGLDQLLKGKVEGKIIDVPFPVQPDWERLRIFTNEPRHLLRAIPPRTIDIITAQRLGMLAVDNALAGFTDFMVSQWLTEYVLVPLELVVLGRKRIPQQGIFWKSVLDKTGQPFDLTRCESQPVSSVVPKQGDERLAWVQEWVRKHPEATLKELCAALEEQSAGKNLAAPRPGDENVAPQ